MMSETKLTSNFHPRWGEKTNKSPKLYTYPTEDFVHSKILEYIPVLKGTTIPLWVTVFQEQRMMIFSTVRLMCVFSHDLILNWDFHTVSRLALLQLHSSIFGLGTFSCWNVYTFIYLFIYYFIHTPFSSVLRERGCQFRPCFPRGLNKWWKTFCSRMRSWCQILSPPFFPIRDRAPFVLTSDMAYVINGGERPTSRFQLFVDLCCQAYNLIRKNSGLFLNLLSLVREKTQKKVHTHMCIVHSTLAVHTHIDGKTSFVLVLLHCWLCHLTSLSVPLTGFGLLFVTLFSFTPARAKITRYANQEHS